MYLKKKKSDWDISPCLTYLGYTRKMNLYNFFLILMSWTFDIDKSIMNVIVSKKI